MSRSAAKVVPHRQAQKMGKLPPRRRTNAELRSREYLTEPEIDKLIKAAEKVGRHGHRDATLILVAYRHALRVSELVSLRRDAIDLSKGFIHINRLKNGRDGTHPLSGREIARASTPQARISRHAARIRIGAWRSNDVIQRAQDAHQGRRGARNADPPAHASSRLRVQAGEPRHRYAVDPSVHGSLEHCEHRDLHRDRATTIQGLLD